MPCLHEKDLSDIASLHIDAQRSNIKNQRARLDEIKVELNRLRNSQEPDALRIKEAEKAIDDLEFHLNGRVKRADLEVEAEKLKKSGLKPERLKKVQSLLDADKSEVLKDPDLKTAEERARVMEALYTKREQLVFEDSAFAKDKDGNSIPRYASVFGAPTVKRMVQIGEKEIADDLMLRSVSLVTSGEATRNPSDYLVTEGIEVKKSLSDGIEHHHIYNNVYVSPNGRVTPNSVRFNLNSQTKKLEIQVIPEYWNSEKHGRNTQFIELMDGAHSGDDSATHLHYYRFTDEESVGVREKIKSKIRETNQAAAARIPKLQAQLDDLSQRREDPKKFEARLNSEIADFDKQVGELDKVEAKYTTPDKNGVLRKNKGLSSDEEQKLQSARERRKEVVKSRDKVQKSLEEHQTFMNLDSNIKNWTSQVKDLESRYGEIKLNVRFPAFGFTNKDEARNAKESLKKQSDKLKEQIKENKRLSREKGSIDQQINDVKSKLEEASLLANLTEQSALELYEKTNGYFHFDKGHQESEDYSRSRPKMNQEIHKYNVRQTVEILQSQGVDPIKYLQEVARRSYKRNLLYNLEPLVEKVAGVL